MKKAIQCVTVVLFALVVSTCLTPLTAHAGNMWFNFRFIDTIGNGWWPEPEAKNDNEANWYITILNNGYSNLSSTNIFGTRMNFSLNEDGSKRKFASGYHIYTGYPDHHPMPYIYTVKKGDMMVIGGKKDNTSSSSSDLYVSGVFCP